LPISDLTCWLHLTLIVSLYKRDWVSIQTIWVNLYKRDQISIRTISVNLGERRQFVSRLVFFNQYLHSLMVRTKKKKKKTLWKHLLIMFG
jgi:hypothetical protein